MKKIPFYITEAFTVKPFQGNPAAIFLDCKDINDEEMFSISKELNIECAFLKEISIEENILSIRYLSSDVEITFSGHATMASISTYIEKNPEILKNNFATFTVKTKAGSIIVDVEKDSDGLLEVKLHTRIPKFG
jgi:trans-2,3-dihydro-3-hydroxyanthranilate isomerase